MSKLYESIEYNNLKFEYVGPNKNVSFYEYMDSKELFNKLKDNQLKVDVALKTHEDFLKNLNEVKIGKKATEQNEMINSLENLYESREEVFNFF